jgi:glutathione peroxidase
MLISLFQFIRFVLVSFYSLSFLDINNNVVNTQSFHGKKVLLVNIASNSPKINQLNGLQQLQQQFKDSLVVVAFPSNSFGNEPKNNTELKQFLEQSYNLSFIIAAKTNVAGNNRNPVYEWLANKNSNGDIDANTGVDFVKYLIDKDGKFMGMFSSKIQPMDSSIIQTINTNY